MTIKLIALDLDGTLLGGIKPYGIRPAALDALASAHAQGVQFALASGRELAFDEELCERYPVLRRVLAGLVTEERYVFLARDGTFAPDTTFNNAAVALESSFLPVTTELVEQCWPDLLKMDEGLVRVKQEQEQARGFIELVFSTAALASQGVDFLNERLPPEIRAVSNVRTVCLRHIEVSKGSALRRLATRLGLAPSEVLAVGDARNDWSMLEERAGFQVATTANAQPEIMELVRQRGGYVAAQPYGDGVAEIVAMTVSAQQPA